MFTTRAINSDVSRFSAMKLLSLTLILATVIVVISTLSFMVYFTTTLDKSNMTCYTGHNRKVEK